MATDWITTAEAAELSGYHPEHIRELVRDGKIKASRKGTMFWIDRASLQRFLRLVNKAQSTDRRLGPRGKSEA
jgi:excisionase family DNA binding protein